MKTKGEIAYKGYCYSSNYKSLISGQQLPSWENLPDNIKEAWNAAAAEVEKEAMYDARNSLRDLIKKHFSDAETTARMLQI